MIPVTKTERSPHACNIGQLCATVAIRESGSAWLLFLFLLPHTACTFTLMKKKIVLFLCVVILAGIAFFQMRRSGEDADIDYLTETVRIGDIVRTVNASGEVGAVQLVSVGAQVSGQIKKLHVKVGQHVSRGDMLAEIDSVPQLNQLETDKARLESYESQLVAKKVALTIARTKYNRELKLKGRNAASQENLEDAKNTLALAEAEVDEVESLIRQARITVNTDEVNLGYTKITAPLDGVVVSVPVDEGQTVNANQTTPTIVQVADLNQMEIKIEISEGDITSVRPGMEIEYTILAEPETVYRAILTSLDPGMTTLTDGNYKSSASGGTGSSSSTDTAVYYYGNAIIDNRNGPLRIGMTTQNTITVAEARDVLLAPLVAVRREGKRKFVRLLTSEGTVERREVVTGLADGINVEIRSGLKEGDAVITAELTQQEIQAETQRRMRRPH